MSTSIDAQSFARYRHYYLGIHTQGQNRLAVSTFLAGLTFAALLTNSIPIPPMSKLPFLNLRSALATVETGNWWSELFLATTTTLLGIATFMFLLTVVSSYRALQQFADLSLTTLTDLNAPLNQASDGTYPAIPSDDVPRLKESYGTYTMSAYLITGESACLSSPCR